MKKIISTAMILALSLATLAGCGNSSEPAGYSGSTPSESESSPANFDSSKTINVISREDGSGTRGAFIELTGIEVRGEDGSRKDTTTKEAIIANKTDIVMTSISTDTYGIGYISLGSLNDTIKAVAVGGVEASAENIKNGSYEISRPFNIATTAEVSELTQEFIDFILSKEGQEIISNSYIAIDENADTFSGSNPSGKLVIAGSSSVNPIMEKLVEAYKEINTHAEIELQMTDSSSGITGTIQGTCDIGMASRELKESELAELTSITIAMDGIAIIVNNDNPIQSLSKEQIRQIYTGEVTEWNDIQ